MHFSVHDSYCDALPSFGAIVDDVCLEGVIGKHYHETQLWLQYLHH